MKENSYKILISKGLFLVSDMTLKSFGDFYSIFENDVIKVRTGTDKSEYYIAISSITEENDWYDLQLIKGMINNESGNTLIEKIDFGQLLMFIDSQ